MHFLYLITLLMILLAAWCIWFKPLEEGYKTLSGLYFHNNTMRTFKNPYDPEWYPGYQTTIGRVIF